MTTWFIGATCVDVIINVDHLPSPEEDLSVISQTMQLGGCAYNASDCFSHFHAPYHLLSPVGSGAYGRFVAEALQNKGVEILIRSDEENGCCYCFVEKNGERTFLSYHGTEYLFSLPALQKFPIQTDDFVYVSGLEIEERTGKEVISYLESLNLDKGHLLFAPGPRIMNIAKDKWQAMLALHPILHLNQNEATMVTDCDDVMVAGQTLYSNTKSPVIITLGKKGALLYNGKEHLIVESVPQDCVVDTIGAGDNHAGMCLFGLSCGWDWHTLLNHANAYARYVTGQKGGQLSNDAFAKYYREEFLDVSHSI